MKKIKKLRRIQAKKIKKTHSKKVILFTSKAHHDQDFNICHSPFNSNEYLISNNSSSFFPLDEEENIIYPKEYAINDALNLELDCLQNRSVSTSDDEEIICNKKTCNISELKGLAD